MKKKTGFLRFAGICLLFAMAAARPDDNPAGAKTKPNIVFIYTDDQTYNSIRALGNSQVITPNMDYLVRNGTSFTHAYNMGAWHGAVCVASRTMLVTGMSVWNARRTEKKLDSLAALGGFWSQQLKKAGYETYQTGKWHVSTPVEALFDHTAHVRPGMPRDTEEGYSRPLSPQDTTWQPWDKSRGGYWQGGQHWSEVLAGDAEGFIRQAATRDAPFFMYLAFNAPHDPRQAPREYIAKYPIEKIRVPENFLAEYTYKEEMGCGQDLRDERLAPFPRTEFAVKKHLQEYYALITHLDDQVGKILSALKKSGKLENTYLFFTSDHGLAVGRHGLMGKQNMFDHSVRPPLLVYGPGIPKGEKRHQQVYLQDIMATTLELAGIPKPGHVFFNSLLPYIKNKNQTGIYPEIYGCYMDVQRMVRTDRYKLIVIPKARKLLLFDMKTDPYELKDLSDNPNYRGIIDDLKKRLARQQKQMNDPLDLSDYL